MSPLSFIPFFNLFPFALHLGGETGKKLDNWFTKSSLTAGLGVPYPVSNTIVKRTGGLDQILTKNVYGRAYDKYTNKDMKKQMEAMASKASPAPPPGPSRDEAVTGARTIMARMAARQGRASTILTSGDQKAVLGIPLQ